MLTQFVVTHADIAVDVAGGATFNIQAQNRMAGTNASTKRAAPRAACLWGTQPVTTLSATAGCILGQ